MTTKWSGRRTERRWRENCWDCWKMREELADMIPDGDDILDVGCGTGLMKQSLPDMDYTGLDHEEDMDPDIVSDSRDIPCDDNSYDVVMCKSHLQHIRQWPLVVEEMKRVSSGSVVIFERCNDGQTVLLGENDYGVELLMLGIEEVMEVLGEVDVTGWSEYDPHTALFINKDVKK